MSIGAGTAFGQYEMVSIGASESDTVSRMRLIQNWTEEPERLVPVN